MPMIHNSISIFLDVLNWLIFIRVILSWLPISHDNPISSLIYQLTEPILAPIKKMLDKSTLGDVNTVIDFSPIIAVLALQLIRMIILSII